MSGEQTGCTVRSPVSHVLLDNDWLSLTAVDPTQGHRAFHYERDLTWTPAAEAVEATPAEPPAPGVADD